ncbi:MAG: ATP-binding protein, partial [Verrucomicrobia subdivision 3 bacterium]|nr:ATP-binding protein [Limisphaerales bacterium]
MRSSDSDTTFVRIARQLRNSPIVASLRFRLILVVLLAGIPAVGVVIYTAIDQRRQGQENARLEVVRLAKAAVATHHQSIESANQLLEILAQLDAVRRGDRARLQMLFTNYVELREIYANLGAVNPQGTVIASAYPLMMDAEPRSAEFFRKAVARRGFAIGEYFVRKDTKEAFLYVGYPVFDTAGELSLVLFSALDLSWLYRMHAEANLPRGSSFTVSDPRRITVLRHPEANLIGEQLRVSWRPRPRPRLGARTDIFRGRDGVLRLYAMMDLTPNEQPSAGLAMGIPVAQAHAAANAAFRRNLLALGIAAVLAAAAAWFGSDFFVLRRVRRLLATTERLTRGELSARTGVAQGDGELHQLARAFDEMAESLQQRVLERERAEANLKLLNLDLEQRVADRTLALQRSNEDLEQFAYVASHDLQEPLRMVTNYLQLLQNRYRAQLDPKAQDFIQIAVDGAVRMHQLIGDLLTYSRVSTGSKPPVPISATEVIKNALLNLKIAIEESGAKITWDELPVVKGDPVQLTQLFQNLIGNAIKFRGEQPPQIHISARRVTKPASPPTWEFSVRDNGIGIASKDFERIFLIFQRLHTREKYPGTGIGLALCKKIVERHDGKIWVESEPGHGTTFHFTLPAET